jgi:hypothetical protein
MQSEIERNVLIKRINRQLDKNYMELRELGVELGVIGNKDVIVD